VRDEAGGERGTAAASGGRERRAADCGPGFRGVGVGGAWRVHRHTGNQSSAWQPHGALASRSSTPPREYGHAGIRAMHRAVRGMRQCRKPASAVRMPREKVSDANRVLHRISCGQAKAQQSAADLRSTAFHPPSPPLSLDPSPPSTLLPITRTLPPPPPTAFSQQLTRHCAAGILRDRRVHLKATRAHRQLAHRAVGARPWHILMSHIGQLGGRPV